MHCFEEINNKDTVPAGEEYFVAHHFSHNASDWPYVDWMEEEEEEVNGNKREKDKTDKC